MRLLPVSSAFCLRLRPPVFRSCGLGLQWTSTVVHGYLQPERPLSKRPAARAQVKEELSQICRRGVQRWCSIIRLSSILC